MNRITTIIFSSLLVLTTAFGCNSQNVGARQPMPASTMAVIDHVSDCDFWYYYRFDQIQEDFFRCEEDPPISSQQCLVDRDNNEQNARVNYETCLKQLPMVDYSCVEQLQPFSLEQDTDGDGVADHWEYQMGLNPCEPCSYGGTPGVDCDGDLNYDRDIRENSEDSEPICGQMYDGEWHPDPEGTNGSPCV